MLEVEAIGRGPGRASRERACDELEALQQALPEIAAVGATLAVISPQVARTPRETEEPGPVSFELLGDLGNHVAEAYGLAFTLPDDLRGIYVKFGIDLAKGNGDGIGGCPCPPAS